jgi:hypothetical protein
MITRRKRSGSDRGFTLSIMLLKYCKYLFKCEGYFGAYSHVKQIKHIKSKNKKHYKSDKTHLAVCCPEKTWIDLVEGGQWRKERTIRGKKKGKKTEVSSVFAPTVFGWEW